MNDYLKNCKHWRACERARRCFTGVRCRISCDAVKIVNPTSSAVMSSESVVEIGVALIG